ncbi:MAG: ATP-dependent metallopeptidase FtsH/Yme1/Tma family protein, partial [Gammaproteobacteria bacterium]|nr:ATP-dependent metallopeptidase FtsH/Yme1/Tma family protein [Gammaproteobacteria bacterium]
MMKNIVLWVIIAMVLMSVFNNFGPQNAKQGEIDYSTFISNVKNGAVSRVDIQGRTITGTLTDGSDFTTYSPDYDPGLMGDLLDNGVTIQAKPVEQTSLLMQIFISWFPMLLLIGVWIFFMRQMQGGGGKNPMSFGKSKAKMLNE